MPYYKNLNERHAAFEAMKLRKHLEYRPRLDAVIENTAKCNGRTIPTASDIQQAQRVMGSEYLRLHNW